MFAVEKSKVLAVTKYFFKKGLSATDIYLDITNPLRDAAPLFSMVFKTSRMTFAADAQKLLHHRDDQKSAKYGNGKSPIENEENS